ncbi:MAG: HNH endonuclease signature motif containing protein [Microbacterium sp.]
MTAHDFWERVDKTGPCWIWLGHIDSKGYGRITTWRNGTIFAHRLAYELVNGPIPEGLQIDHLCRIPACVNPDHLEPVTGRENTLRGVGPTAENARKTSCKRGHPFDAENTCIRSDGRRVCIACRRARDKRRDRRRVSA